MTTTTDEQLPTEDDRVGETLSALYTREGFSRVEFARELGISRSQLQNIEAGRRALPEHLVYRAARILNVRPLAIRRVPPNPPAPIE